MLSGVEALFRAGISVPAGDRFSILMLGRFAKAKLLSRSNTGIHEGFFFVNLFSVGIVYLFRSLVIRLWSKV